MATRHGRIALSLDDCDFLAHALVGVKVHGQATIVLLDDNTRGLLNRLGANTTLRGEDADRGQAGRFNSAMASPQRYYLANSNRAQLSCLDTTSLCRIV
eukprot:353077-Chlamydomonas_euryale.AAC.7